MVSFGEQERRMMHNLRNYEVPLHRYIAMMDLQVDVFSTHLLFSLMFDSSVPIELRPLGVNQFLRF